MKTKKLLMPVLGVSAITAATVTPLMSLTSCGATIWNVLNMWYDSNGDLYLGGIKDGATERNVRSVFGDTLTIPKEVDYITPYAFVNRETMETTIPSFIKHFRFEDGYECKEIPAYAFYGAPFESVEIECERIDGYNSDGRGSWKRPEGGWGLQALGDHAFFQTYDLTYVKLCASIRNSAEVVFGYDDGNNNILSYINTIDVSDWKLDDDGQDEPLRTFNTMFSLDLASPVPVKPGQDPIRGKIITRSYNGTDCLKELNAKPLYIEWYNKFRQAFGTQPESGDNPVNWRFGDYWDIETRYNKMDHYGDYVIQPSTDPIKGISHLYPINFYPKFFDGFMQAKMEVDLSKWEGELPANWQVVVDQPTGIVSEGWAVYVNDRLLTPQQEVFVNIGGSGFYSSVQLKKTDKIYITFMPNTMVKKISFVFSRKTMD